MSAEPTKQLPVAPADPAPGHASGNGADTALEALIRQRKRVETPEERVTTQPAAPAQDAR